MEKYQNTVPCSPAVMIHVESGCTSVEKVTWEGRRPVLPGISIDLRTLFKGDMLYRGILYAVKKPKLPLDQMNTIAFTLALYIMVQMSS